MAEDKHDAGRIRKMAAALLERYGRQVTVWHAAEADVGPFRILRGRVDSTTEMLDVMYGPDTVATWQLRADGTTVLIHFDPGPWCDAFLALNQSEEPAPPHLD